MRQELAFARKIPRAEALVDHIGKWLQAPSEFWSDAASTKRKFEGALEELRYLGAPEWFIRGLLGLYALRLKMHGGKL